MSSKTGPSNETPEPADQTSTVDLSIGIPSFNRAAHLEKLLASLVDALDGLNQMPTVEVVVVLDGSIDESQSMLESMIPDFPVSLRYIWQANAGLAAARNRVVAESRGELVWLLDDDMTVTSRSVETHLGWDRDETAIAYGPCHVEGSEHLDQFYGPRWEALTQEPEITDPEVVSFANTSSPRALLSAHRFDERFVGYGLEDYELAQRLLDGGERIRFLPEAAVTHFNDKGYKEMLRHSREEAINRTRLTMLYPDDPKFAPSKPASRIGSTLHAFSDHRFATPLWWTANLLRFASVPAPRKFEHRLIMTANLFARQSGYATAQGKGASLLDPSQ